MTQMCVGPTNRILFGKLLLFCAFLLTLLFLYGYTYGEWSIRGDKPVSWSVGNIWSSRNRVQGNTTTNHNTARSGENTHLTPKGFNMTKELIRLNPKIFSALPREFLPDYKNPCWFEKSVKASPDSHFQEKRIDSESDFLLRCLPYAYIIGQQKCGTTDLYSRITKHPDVVGGHGKEPHWWARGRFQHHVDFKRYLNYFHKAALVIRTRIKKYVSSSGQQVDGSSSTMCDNRHWKREFWDTPNNEPPILVANLIRAVQPKARIIISLRNPTERLYSEYLYFWKGQNEKSAKIFHNKVNSAINNYKYCLRNNSVRSCVYQPKPWLPGNENVRLRLGLYEVYLRDWFSIFPRDQILVQRLEDHSKDQKVTMAEVFKFLQLEPVGDENGGIFSFKKKVRRKPHTTYASMGPMLPETRKVLDRFYRPYNRRLAELLNNTGFLWL